MKAAPFEFRYRFWVLLAIYVLGFTAPWDYWLHLDGAGPNTHVWGRLAIMLSRAGVGISAAFNVVLAAGIALAFAGAALRTWGTANLGAKTMRGEDLSGGSVPTSGRDVGHPVLVVNGPYRYVRNPLYVGLWLNALALALLMPPSGAVFLLAALSAFLLRLIPAEETHLAAQLGPAYAEYCARVRRVMPRLRMGAAIRPTSLRDVGHPAGVGISPQVPESEAPGAPVLQMGQRARWGKAALAEIFLWGTALSFAAAGWRYDAHLLIQCVLVSFGLSLVTRGFLMQPARRDMRPGTDG